MNSSQLRVLADFAHWALEYKLLRPSSIVTWADELIAESEFAVPWMLAMSFVDTKDPYEVDVQRVLKEVPGIARQEESGALLNALILREWRTGKLSIGAVRGLGWNIYQNEYLDRDMRDWGVVVECEGEMLDENKMSIPQMRNVIDRELARFEPWLTQLPPWTKSPSE